MSGYFSGCRSSWIKHSKVVLSSRPWSFRVPLDLHPNMPIFHPLAFFSQLVCRLLSIIMKFNSTLLTRSFNTTAYAKVSPLFPILFRANNKALPRTGTIPNLTRGLPPKQRIRDVSKVIAVASAKGGVGKSTIAGTIPYHV